MHKAIFPEGLENHPRLEELKMSPAILSGDHLFLTGASGAAVNGHISDDAEEQFHVAFDKIGGVLDAAGLDFGHLVEMTSYHIGLRDHLDLFTAVRAKYVRQPYPAWTAVDVSGFSRERVIIEIRAVARTQ